MESWRPWYPRASRREKTRILDEFVALTGYHRKSAIRPLRHGYRPPHLDRRGRPCRYTPDVKPALLAVREACGYICSKRFAPFLPEIVAALKRHGELQIRPEMEKLLLQLSPATIDHLLRTHWPKPLRGARPRNPVPSSSTRSVCGPLPTGTSSDRASWRWTWWATPGESAKGEYLHTLTAVDVVTCWCKLEVLPNRGQQAVREAIDRIRGRLPFPLLRIDSDDSAFLNGNLTRYCLAQRITFTCGRPYKKNDQAHAEEKNWSAVRKLVGHVRYESAEALALLRVIYADWRLFLNFFQPVRKLLAKERVGSNVRKRYDRAQTPYHRVLASPEVREESKARLREMYQTLNPEELQRRIQRNLEGLRRLHG